MNRGSIFRASLGFAARMIWLLHPMGRRTFLARVFNLRWKNPSLREELAACAAGNVLFAEFYDLFFRPESALAGVSRHKAAMAAVLRSHEANRWVFLGAGSANRFVRNERIVLGGD